MEIDLTKSLDQAIPQAELPYHGAMYWLFLKDETFHNMHIWQKYFDLFDTCCFIFWHLVPDCAGSIVDVSTSYYTRYIS